MLNSGEVQEKAKADYEKASTQASEDTSHYNEAKKEYAAMADYQAKLAQYLDFGWCKPKKAQYDKDLAEYNKANTSASTPISKYAYEIGWVWNSEEKVWCWFSCYNQAQSKYQSDLATYKTQKHNTIVRWLKWKLIKIQQGHLGVKLRHKVWSYRSEPTARATGANLVNAQPILRAGLNVHLTASA